jgi:hypothetical protein
MRLKNLTVLRSFKKEKKIPEFKEFFVSWNFFNCKFSHKIIKNVILENFSFANFSATYKIEKIFCLLKFANLRR